MADIMTIIAGLSILAIPILFLRLIISLFRKKNRKKSAVSLLIAFLVMYISVYCVVELSPETGNDSKGGTHEITQYSTNYIESTATSSSFIPTPENSIIYSDNGIEVSFTKIYKTQYFKYEIKNNNEHDIQFSIDAVAVNNCMVSDLMSMGIVTTGNKAVEEYDLSGSKDYGITDVETLDIFLVFYERDTYNTIDKTVCHIDISPTREFSYSCNLSPFYEDEYLVACAEQTGSKYDDFEVFYYNKSSEIISVALSEVSINGVMLSNNIKGANILPNCYAYSGSSNGTVSLWNATESEIREKELEPIERIEGKVIIWADIFNYGYFTSENLLFYSS